MSASAQTDLIPSRLLLLLACALSYILWYSRRDRSVPCSRSQISFFGDLKDETPPSGSKAKKKTGLRLTWVRLHGADFFKRYSRFFYYLADPKTISTQCIFSKLLVRCSRNIDDWVVLGNSLQEAVAEKEADVSPSCS